MPKTGTVKWFNARKGYGFIEPDDQDEDGGDIFVHYTSIQLDDGENTFRTLYHGEKVEFEVEEGEKGQEAREVSVIEPSPRRIRRQTAEI